MNQVVKVNSKKLLTSYLKSGGASKDVELLETNSNLLDENISLKERIKQLRSSSKDSSIENENQALRQKVNSLDLKPKI